MRLKGLHSAIAIFTAPTISQPWLIVMAVEEGRAFLKCFKGMDPRQQRGLIEAPQTVTHSSKAHDAAAMGAADSWPFTGTGHQKSLHTSMYTSQAQSSTDRFNYEFPWLYCSTAMAMKLCEAHRLEVSRGSQWGLELHALISPSKVFLQF